MARASESRARWSLLVTRGAPAGDDDEAEEDAEEPPDEAPPPPEGREPWMTVTLPPSTYLQPRSLAWVALLVYSLPQR